VVLGTIAAPGLAGDVTTRVAEELAEDLARSYGAVGWRTVLEVDRLVEPPALTTDLIDAARRKLLERGLDLAVVVTDLPLKRNGRPVALFNAATAATVIVGILVLYLALFAIILLGSGLILPPEVVAAELGHDADLVDYLVIAWFVASLTTIAGALGAALESDEEVHEAAYSVAPSKAAADEQKRHRRRQAAV
jgi:hypothetical protein